MSLVAVLCRDCLQSAYGLQTTLTGVIGYCEGCGKLKDCAEIPVSLLIELIEKQNQRNQGVDENEEAQRRIRELERLLAEANECIRKLMDHERARQREEQERWRFNPIAKGKHMINSVVDITLDVGDILLRTAGEMLGAALRGTNRIITRVRGY